MTGTAVVNVLIGIAVVALLIVRQLSVRRLRENPRPRVILIIIGVIETVSYLNQHSVTTHDLVLVILSVAIGGALGVLRAYTVRLWRLDGSLVRQGSWVTALLWLVSIGQHFGVEAFVQRGFASSTLLLYLGISLAIQQWVMLERASQMGLLSGGDVPLGR